MRIQNQVSVHACTRMFISSIPSFFPQSTKSSPKPAETVLAIFLLFRHKTLTTLYHAIAKIRQKVDEQYDLLNITMTKR